MSSTKNDAPTAEYEEPGIEFLTRNSLMTSPPRAGMTLLNPYAAMYAPQIRRKAIVSPGYAARRTLKYARERIVRYRPKNVSPTMSGIGRISARRPRKSLTARMKFAMSSPIAAVGTALAYGPLEAEEAPDARVGERRHDEVGRVEVDAGERRHPDHGHARRAGGGHAGLRVLERDAVPRVGADGGGRGEVDVGRGLGVLDVLGADDRVEAVVDPGGAQRARGELPAGVRREADRDRPLAQGREQLERARHRLDPRAVELGVDELAQLDAQLVAAAGLAEVALHRERRLHARRAEHLALVVERELGAVAGVERALGARPCVLRVEGQAVVVEDHRRGHAAAHDGASARRRVGRVTLNARQMADVDPTRTPVTGTEQRPARKPRGL